MSDIEPDSATDLYDVRRLAELIGVKPATIKTLRRRGRLPAPTSANINGGSVWTREIVEDFYENNSSLKNCEVSKSELPGIVDLFSGCGGMSLGFKLAGFDVLHGFDNWNCAVATYGANLGHDARLMDLSDVEATIAELEQVHEELEETPAIIGGPPCQDFSSAGKRTEGDRADLTEKFAQVVRHFSPPFFVMENVARAERSAAFSRSLEVFRSAGYSVGKIVLDASRCGVPQSRKRLITVGARSARVTESIMLALNANQSAEKMTVRDWFGDSLGVDYYYRHPRSYARRAVFSIDEPSPTIRGVNRPVPSGYPGHPGDAAPVVDARPLTTLERASVQSFPDGFQWVGSRTETEQMIGNAVPVRLAKYVAQAIADNWSEA